MTRITAWDPTGINSRAIATQYFCDLFFLEGINKASRTEDTTPYNASLTQKLVINELEETSSIF